MITILSSSWLWNKFSLSASLEMQGEQYGEYAYCSFPLLSFSQLNPLNIKSDWVVLFFVGHYANVCTGSVVIGSPLERQFLFLFSFFFFDCLRNTFSIILLYKLALILLIFIIAKFTSSYCWSGYSEIQRSEKERYGQSLCLELLLFSHTGEKFDVCGDTK